MVDTLIKLRNNDSYYIMDELSYNGKQYLLGVSCDPDNDYMNTNDQYIFEYRVEDGVEVVDDVLDDRLAKTILDMFINK